MVLSVPRLLAEQKVGNYMITRAGHERDRRLEAGEEGVLKGNDGWAATSDPC